MRPYIGITGFMSRDEVEEILSFVPDSCKQMLMIGVLASDKTLSGAAQKKPNRYPEHRNIKNIFPGFAVNSSQNRTTLNLIHYNTGDNRELSLQLFHMLCGSCDGFQLNIPWPEKYALSDLEKCFDLDIVLQVGGKTPEVFQLPPEQVAQRIFGYRGIITHVLFDMSGGKGVPLKYNVLRPYLEALKLIWPDINIGVAGGLSAATLCLAEPLIKAFPDISINAEGLLRDTNDKLHIEKAKAYLWGAMELYQKYG
jgi:hypothetical protein